MLFNSLVFVVFFGLVLVAKWLIGPRLLSQNLMLLVASYTFYGWWDVRFLALIAVSTGVDYVVAQLIAATDDANRRRRLLIASIAVNLTLLGFFKYFGFFVGSATGLLSSLGFDVASPVVRILLPVGISFYTFQSISYTFDVFRRRIEPERSIVTFALYVAYFPQLLAGPIERARNLLPQLRVVRATPTIDEVWSAGWLIFTGLFKKLVLADALAPIVAERFADPGAHGMWSLMLGVYAFSIQIYGDFSGYSSIARGTSRLLGVELMRNFEQPYLSRNVSQFWRTWHISLSTWLHDYLYVPLGGNRDGRWRTYRNLLLTMVLGGLWHGPTWGFVIWGGIHGTMLAGHRLLGHYEERGRPRRPRLGDLPGILITFHLVSLTWILLRAQGLEPAYEYARGLARVTDLSSPGAMGPVPTLLLVGAAFLSMIALDLIDRSRDELDPLWRWSPVALGAAAGLALAAMIVFSGGTPEPFIYFQF